MEARPEKQEDSALEEIKCQLDYYAQYHKCGVFGPKENLRLNDKIRRFLESKSAGVEKQKASASVLWAVRKHLSGRFSKHAFGLLNHSVFFMELDDANKMRFYHYMISLPRYMEFSAGFFDAMSDFKLHGKKEELQGKQIFYKVGRLLGRYRLSDKRYYDNALRLLPFVNHYAKNAPQADDRLLKDTAEILFNASVRLPDKWVSLYPLVDILERTERLKHCSARMNDIFLGSVEDSSARKIDKKGVQTVLAMYGEAYKRNPKFRDCNNLYARVSAMMTYVVSKYNYTRAEANSLAATVRKTPAMSFADRQLANLGQNILKAYHEVHPRQVKRRPVAQRFSYVER